MPTTDISCKRGDTASWTINCRQDSLPLNLTGGSLEFTARRSYGGPVVFERTTTNGGIVINADPATGVAVITLLPDDTSGLPDETVVLVYSVRAITPAGAWVVSSGHLTVEPVANRI